MKLRLWLIRFLGVKECGAFGGIMTNWNDESVKFERWCRKPFGHEDSCMYTAVLPGKAAQPGYELREAAKGWRD